jgi:cysteine synthase
VSAALDALGRIQDDRFARREPILHFNLIQAFRAKDHGAHDRQAIRHDEHDFLSAALGNGPDDPTVAKAIVPSCTVIGVELEVSCPFQTSVRAGRLVEIVPGDTLADGLGGNPDPQTITFDYIQRLVDRIVTVSEPDLAAAMVGLIDAEHLITEGAGAAATAALVGRRVDVGGRETAVMVTGANVDLSRVITLMSAR